MKKLLLSILLLAGCLASDACTSVIVTARRSASGKPVMLKNRDTDCLDNRLEWYEVGDFHFIGLVNAPIKDGEVWAGTNDHGFSICNTAVYNFDEDSVTASLRDRIYHLQLERELLNERLTKAEALAQRLHRAPKNNNKIAIQLRSIRKALEENQADIDSLEAKTAEWAETIKKNPKLVRKITDMDKEGIVMYKALGCCTTVEDFLHMLDTMVKPLGVEANFAVIDAQGGAMYVETNNWRHVVWDVNKEEKGYRVQTNFAFSGTYEKRMGQERYLTCCAEMAELDSLYADEKMPIDHQWIFDHICRSYRHEVMGMKEGDCPTSGVVVDQDFIPRRITSAAIVMEGDVMWSLMGYPACGVGIPAMVCDRDRLPASVKRLDDGTCRISNTAMQIKMKYLFPGRISNGKHYLRLGVIMSGKDGKPGMLDCAHKAEETINAQFAELYNEWKNGELTDNQFYEKYETFANECEAIYESAFEAYIHQ